MIGLGTQDTGDEAADFVQTYETYSFPMYWDETFESWAALGITSQPAALLFAADGEFIAGWSGRFPSDDVLALAADS